MSVAEIFETMTYGPAPEAATPALDWLKERGISFDLFIGNRWVAPHDGERFETINPATTRPLARIAQAGPSDVEAAVHAARQAFPAWSAEPGHVRARYLYALARQVQRHSRLLAVLETLDNGKPIRETRDIDVPLVARHFAYHAGWAQLMATELPDYQPIGVVGQIIPWNFPLLMLAWKIAPALAMGNTVVLKPAEFTSLTALAFAEIVQEAGLPPGVVNVITGDGRTGEALVNHHDVDKIAFTGSTEVGRLIRRATAGTGKRLSLELGGKSPFVVFDDADLDGAVEGVVDAIWFNQGQVCCAGSRLLVQEDVADRMIARVKTRMERLRVGDPLDKAVDIGAIVAPVQLQRIQGLVERGVQEGATLWQPSWACPTDGYFFPPTLFTDVAPASTIAQVEIFGPVLVAMSFRTPTEAVALANNTAYGLAASVWSENINLALDVARRIKAGTVWINSTNLFDAASGFGGYRESGYGREGGKEGLYEYLKRRATSATGARSPGAAANRMSDEHGHHGNPEARPSNGREPAHAAEQETSRFAPRSGHIEPRDQETSRFAPKGGRTEPTDQETPAFTPGSGSFAGLAAGFTPPNSADGLPPIDRTPKLFIGGKQVRPDSGYSLQVRAPDGRLVGEVGEGNRKDIRNAVEAARAALGWAGTTAYNRAQILYYLAENLSARAEEFAWRIAAMEGSNHRGAEGTGALDMAVEPPAPTVGSRGKKRRGREEPVEASQIAATNGSPGNGSATQTTIEPALAAARAEVELSIERLFTYAAWADKYDGRVAGAPFRGLTVAVPEPIGVLGILCPDECPLLAFISLLAPAIAMGNTVVIAPSERHPLSATDLYQVLETSDVPAGVVNIVTGKRDALAAVLAAHDDVDAVWYAGERAGARAVETASAGNLKRTWTDLTGRDWTDPSDGEEFLREATQVKNIWVPHGE